MGKMKDLILMIVAIVVILLMFPLLLSGVHTTQTTTQTQTVADVVTTSGTSATITLTTSLWHTNLANVTIAGGAGDTPVASAIGANGLTMTVTGLATSATRALTVSYPSDALADYTGLSTFVSLVPFLVMIAAIGALIFGAIGMFKSG